MKPSGALKQLLLIVLLTLSSVVELPAFQESKVAVVDAGVGPCAIDFKVTDDKGSPVYGAKIHTHIAYGFIRARRLDLEVGTNSDGNARFTGLPDKLKQELVFRASQGDREGSVSYTLSKTCPPKQDTIVLKSPQEVPK